ncbi:MAG: hypothetical protein A3H70_03395 [Candidatus Komeilibacteria bacterium RIFCSPLOWO2_02_FULL_48_11]|uniref:Uncharacterized protein n=1 Tax=Candidatus Komeilibacteria bacterium RIFCSPLOWO2_02_FULL_48_11 TaxID=1798553 RepID=A0A1G2BUJ9_9BACT|nr:MAG: hypothetical protein A3H70_03395 [Candidatus Komeilibacteria bacterium RIFCSPLOWO2_02_FULL_48_11]
MDRDVINQAIEFFVDPSMRRYPGYVKDYWLELRLCLDKKPNQRKRAKILGQIGTPTGLKASISDFAASSQADWLLAMAYKVSHDAKKENHSPAKIEVAYAFKNFLLNVLILLFAERHKVTSCEGVTFAGQSTLFLRKDKDNQLNLDLRFLVGYSYSRDAGSQIYRQPTAPQNAIGFHLPTGQTVAEVKAIVKKIISGS